MTRFPAWTPLLPLSLILLFGACAGGGCGGEPGQEAGTTTGASNPGKTAPANGGPVNASQFDSKSWDQARQGQGHGGKGPTPGLLGPPRVDWLQPVMPVEWDMTVARSSVPVLVMAAKAECPDCTLAGSALRTLKPKFADWEFRRFDAQTPEAPSLLPSGMAAKALPAFVIYEKGEPVSRLQGLPFPRAKNESDADYRNRLYRWFRDALTQKNLAFGQRT
jgi:hypothetical protein